MNYEPNSAFKCTTDGDSIGISAKQECQKSDLIWGKWESNFSLQAFGRNTNKGMSILA